MSSPQSLESTNQSYTLVSHHLCPYVQRAAILLMEKNIPHQRKDVDLGNKPDWFKAISPLGKVPLLQVDDKVLFESAVICEYLDEVSEHSHHPADPLERAYHRSWIEFGSSTLNAIGAFYNAKDSFTFEEKRKALRDKFEWLEQHLPESLSSGPGSYFEGETFHVVDAVYGPTFRYLDVFDQIGDFGLLDGLVKTRNYRKTLAARESVQKAVAPDYPERLMDFLKRRGSHLSTMIKVAA